MRISGPEPSSACANRWGPAISAEGVHYSVWAPEHSGLEVHARGPGEDRLRIIELSKDAEGFHRGLDRQGRAGDRYQFRIGDRLLPDPASRAQEGTVHEASVVVDASAFPWTDTTWARPQFRDLVVYEIHIGTFTTAGTFRAAIDRLPFLRELGVTAIQLMPIADFPGSRSWGYDGVLIYAPARAYGSPDDLRALVNAAHAEGIAVILDVVYNHFGPDGNYLATFSPHFSTDRHHTPWGSGFNVDGEHSRPVREFFLGNPVYWMEDFHIDGFRFDATHEIADESPKHILTELVEVIHGRGGYAIAEDSRNERGLLLRAEFGGMGFDAVWADDFHHVARVMQTGEQESYYRSFRGTLPELIDTLQHGWLYRGQAAVATGKRRGTPCADLPPAKFLHCLSNHDQVGNRAFGERISRAIRPEAYRALTVLLCLSPYTPMLFMGQEWAASTPFLFFTDHHEALGKLIREGRQKEFSGFASFRNPSIRAAIPDPQAEDTFRQSKLEWTELLKPPHDGILALHRECLALRRKDAAFRPATRETWRVQQVGAGMGAIRFLGERAEYLLVFSLAGSGTLDLTQDEFTAPAAGQQWTVVFSSDEPRFGGNGQTKCAGTQCIFRSAASVLLGSTAHG